MPPGALRLYERHGLLVPAVIDEDNGYRYPLSRGAHRCLTVRGTELHASTRGELTTAISVTERPRLTALRAAWMFDGTSETLLADRMVVVDGARSLDLRGALGMPTIVAAGPPITTSGGHCHFLGGATKRGEAGLRAAVREHAERGRDVIKIMASGGTLAPGTGQDMTQFSSAALRAAVEEAHRSGLPITAHVHATQAIADAVAAGVDRMEHVSFWSTDGIDEPGDVIEQIAGKGIVVGATVGLRPVPGAIPPPEVLKRLPLPAPRSWPAPTRASPRSSPPTQCATRNPSSSSSVCPRPRH